MAGRLVTLEGIDGSGKATQAKLLVTRLQENGVPAKLFSFPAYTDTFFGKEIGAYLRGEYGSLDSVHPKFAALLFAGDRFEKRDELLKELEKGAIVVCDRYTDSNIAHQCSRIDSVKKREQMQAWLEHLEFDLFRVPKPDITFYLQVPLQQSKALVLEKSERQYTIRKKDIHEENDVYLANVADYYEFLCHERGWSSITCFSSGRMKSIQEIHSELMTKLRKLNYA